ncbi:hypothetical protein C9374_007241 [Naegleria lovaniensis]|uniref:GATA-type domain-containing protein n=1 Tax=Naegleria lovaniensis TaxID=51637 RepID=A0AA88GZB1_NAELO|nr:uncharacterized protein C9374_007241 [Naegleria lovaniensis]KAG2393710.1 hypothetical protein C9374_007241 [Naegleria lovaniensis]
MDLFSPNDLAIEDWNSQILLQDDEENDSEHANEVESVISSSTGVKHVLLSPLHQIYGAAATCKPTMKPISQTHHDQSNHSILHDPHPVTSHYVPFQILSREHDACSNILLSNCPCSSIPLQPPRQLLTHKRLFQHEIQTTRTPHHEFPTRMKTKRTHTKNSQCENCGTHSTPTWRKNPSTGQTLCNKCGLYELRYGMNRPAKEEYLKLGRRKRHVAVEESSTSNVTMSPSEDDLSESECKKMKQDHIISTHESNLKGALNHEGHVHGWSSLNVLKDRLKEASERYPDIIQTLISLIRKHVLTQPQVLSQILQTSQIAQQQHSLNHGESRDLSFTCTDMLLLEKSNE